MCTTSSNVVRYAIIRPSSVDWDEWTGLEVELHLGGRHTMVKFMCTSWRTCMTMCVPWIGDGFTIHTNVSCFGRGLHRDSQMILRRMVLMVEGFQ